MSITTFNIRGRCFVCEGRFVDPYSLVCYKDQCRGRVICGSCLGIANDACRVGMKCSICRINSIVSIIPVGPVNAAFVGKTALFQSFLSDLSKLHLKMK